MRVRIDIDNLVLFVSEHNYEIVQVIDDGLVIAMLEAEGVQELMNNNCFDCEEC